MIEIPESRTLAAQLQETIAGKKIEQVIAAKSPHKFAFYAGDPAEYPQKLQGKQVTSAVSLAGLVQLNLDHDALVFNDGTNLRFWKEGEKRPQKHQLLLEFDDGSGLSCSVQMYGGMILYENGVFDNPYYLVAKEKISPLDDGFDLTYFHKIYDEAKPNLSVKGLLATEQRIPGLGNGVLQDILFYAKLHPKTKISTLTEDEITAVYNSVKQTLKDMTARGGRDTEKDLFGCQGGYSTILSKNTLKSPCPVCGGPLEKMAYLGGNVYVCTACQKLKK